MKKYIKMEKAWLISWDFYSPDKDKELKKLGINNEIIDILDSRQTFSYVLDFVKHIYVLLNNEIYGKILFARRSKQAKIERDGFFERNLLHTCYQDNIYREMMNAFRIKGMDSKEHQVLFEKWRKCPFYISLGHNPSIYARIVYDLKLSFNQDDSEQLEWNEPLESGEREKCNLIINKYL